MMLPHYQLCMVTLSLFDTLLSLHCEELLLELALKYLIAGRHVPAGHRLKVNRTDAYPAAVEHFLELTPEVMRQTPNLDGIDATNNNINNRKSSSASANSTSFSTSHQTPMSKTIGANWNHYGLNNATDSLYANYRAYLFDARQRITQCQSACTRWSSSYRLQSNNNSASSGKRSEKTLELIRDFLSECADETENVSEKNGGSGGGKQLDSLQSLGESSGYESFKYRVDDDSSGEDRTIDVTSTSKVWISAVASGSWKTSSRRTDDSEYEFDYADDVFAQETISLGMYIFLM